MPAPRNQPTGWAAVGALIAIVAGALLLRNLTDANSGSTMFWVGVPLLVLGIALLGTGSGS